MLIFVSIIVPINSFSFELSNKNASETARQVYHYLTTRNSFEQKRVFSGQNCYHGNEIVKGYPELFDGLYAKTGEYPAFIGVDYEYVKRFSSLELSQTNAPLIKHWRNGGLVTINWAPFNPWTNSNCRDLNKVNLNELTDPSTTVYKKWHTELDRIANGLAELRDSGVIVVWRPLQEMNGNWFWWGISAHPESNEPFNRVWRDMFAYFSNEKGLDNLIWELSLVESQKELDYYFPGNDVVDIVGSSVYKTTFLNSNYESMLALGEPIAACETGPDHCCMDGTWDNMTVINGIRNQSPNTMYFLHWHNWVDHWVAILSNQNAKNLMQDPWVINRSNVNWKKDESNQSPTVDLTFHIADSVMQGETLALNANASDPDGNIVKVQFFNGYNKLGEDTISPYEFQYENIPGGKLYLNTRAIDDKGAVSFSEFKIVDVQIPELPYTNLLLNGEFDKGLNFWGSWGPDGTSFTTHTDNNSTLSGKNSLRVEISNGGKDDWMCQIMCGIGLKSNIEYEIGFKAKSTKMGNIRFQLRQAYSPYSGYWEKIVSVNEVSKNFGPFTFKNKIDDKNGQVIFFLGGRTESTVWLDSIVVYEKNILGPPNSVADVENAQIILTPNPLTGNLITIGTRDFDVAGAEIVITDLAGRRVFKDKLKNNLIELPFYTKPGIYLFHLTTNNRVYTQKFIKL